MLVLLLFLFIFLSAFFSGIEIGFVSLSPIKIEVLRRKQPRVAAKIRALRKDWNLFLSTTLIGNDLSLVAASSLFTYIANMWLGITNEAIITALFTVVMLIFAESGPKILFRYHSERLVPISLPLFTFFQTIFYPLALLFTYLTQGLLRLFKIEFRDKRGIFVTREELRMLLYQGSTAGELHREERTLIRRIFDFSTRKVKDIMTPIDKVALVEDSWDMSMILNMAKERGYSRYPVKRDGRIIGFVHILDLLYIGAGEDWRDYIRPIIYVYEQAPVGQVFYQMQSVKANMVIAFSDNYQASGVVTMKDIMDEIVGEIV